MADTFNTFPMSKAQALALLYVEKQASSEHTPEDLLDMYDDAYDRIREHSKAKRNSSEFFCVIDLRHCT